MHERGPRAGGRCLISLFPVLVKWWQSPIEPMPHVAKPPQKVWEWWHEQAQISLIPPCGGYKCVHESNASLCPSKRVVASSQIPGCTLPRRVSHPPMESGLRDFQALECTVLRPAKSQANQLITLPVTGDPQTHEYRQECQHSIFLPRCIEQNYFHSDKTCKRKM